MIRRTALCLVLGASALLVGCGTSSNASTSDGGATGVTDGAATDAFVAPTDGGDGGSNSTAEDAGEEAGPICYAAGTPTDTCRTCCQNEHPAGYKVFGGETVACACQASLCGPPDGGTDAGDAGSDAASDASDDAATDAAIDAGDDGGLFGQALCTATCDGTQLPNAACNSCILQTLGEVSSYGPCGLTVVSQCLTDSDCTEYFGCIEKCAP